VSTVRYAPVATAVRADSATWLGFTRSRSTRIASSRPSRAASSLPWAAGATSGNVCPVDDGA
jgi:hypothetical protein